MIPRLQHSTSNCRLIRGSRVSSTIRFRHISSTISNQPFRNVNTKVPDSNQQNKSQTSQVKTIVGKIDINAFRTTAWASETPLLLQDFHNLPAIKNWFQNNADNPFTVFSSYMKPFEDTILPYEFTVFSSSSDGLNSEGNTLPEYLKWLRKSSEYKETYLPALIGSIIQSNDKVNIPNNSFSFQQFEAPLSLIMSACQFNLTRKNLTERIKRLYVAQSNLSNLPKPLSRDLPTPDIVKLSGKGDIYNSSIWLGLQPTYTPLHRDPNPNLFCQLVGSKRIRLMTPDDGDDVYARVRRELSSSGSSRFRGTEMMEGRERELLHRAVWDKETVSEVSLGAGDALFIPKGWWHSVASDGKDGELNSSVNWWFR